MSQIPEFEYSYPGFSTIQQYLINHEWESRMVANAQEIDRWDGLTPPGLEGAELPFRCSCCGEEVIVDCDTGWWSKILQNHLQNCNPNLAYLAASLRK